MRDIEHDAIVLAALPSARCFRCGVEKQPDPDCDLCAGCACLGVQEATKLGLSWDKIVSAKE